MITMRAAGRSDIGQVRENNEDAIVTSNRLALVADGMGGHPGGEIAASTAAGVVPAVFTGRSVDELEAAVRAANWAIRDRAVPNPGSRAWAPRSARLDSSSTDDLPSSMWATVGPISGMRKRSPS